MNYYQFLTSAVSCSACGWSGSGKETATGEMFEELYEYHCPSCRAMLGICSYPTVKDARANWALVPESERRHVEAVEQRRARFRELSLKAAGELPDLGSAPFVIDWDFEDDEQSHKWTVLRQGDRVVWREPAVYEGDERFKSVVSILLEKYGRLLKDVVPTSRSELYLYGDRLGSPANVAAIRKRVRESADATGCGG